MKRTIVNMSQAAALTFAFSLTVGATPQTCSAADLGLDSVLGLNHPSSHHVIDLLMHNRMRQSIGLETGVMPTAPMPYGVAGPKPGDLELLEVNMISDGADTCGPIYQVSFRNTSCFAVRDFRMSIVGVLCRITPASPCTMVCVPCIDAGETKCIEIQLPATAMTMGPHGAQPAPFDTLVVALDSLDELVECNELNNVAILKRVEIGMVVIETPAAPAITAPVPAAPSAPVPGEAAAPAPGDTASPSPLENIDLDELDLGDAEESALRIALETM